MRPFLMAVRKTNGGPVYWLIMTLVFVVETAVLVAMVPASRGIARDICLAIFVAMFLLSGFIAGVKINDHWLSKR